MSAKFTSGTWTASPEEGATEWRVDAGTWGIAICADFPGDGEVEANARLIAASPTMYEYINKLANNGDENAASIIANI